MRRLHCAIRRLRDSEGASMIEAALITPMLIMLTVGVMEFGSMLYAFLALQNGVSQATRYAITGQSLGTASRVDSVKTVMRQATPTLTIPDNAFTFSHLPEGGSAFVAGVGGPGEVEKVTVAYTWTFFTPMMRPFFPSGRITISVDSTMKNEPKFQ